MCAQKLAPVHPGEVLMGNNPNIIFMVADNLGCEAVDYYGEGIFETPRLNAMASEGVVFDKLPDRNPAMFTSALRLEHRQASVSGWHQLTDPSR